MQKELEELQPQLVETAKENTKMMKVCTRVLHIVLNSIFSYILRVHVQRTRMVLSIANSLLKQVIEKESAEVEARSELVRKDEAVANQKASESQALKEECESDLAEAIPALEAALAALNTLKVCTSNLVIKS